MYISFFLIGQEEEECEGPPVLPSVRELKHKFRVSNPDLKTQVKSSELKILLLLPQPVLLRLLLLLLCCRGYCYCCCVAEAAAIAAVLLRLLL
jgi:hypothetical protein